VTRGADLSSTSVVHYQLQKLERLGLIEKTAIVDTIVKKKAWIVGYV
jgi:predicted MarR family transcription regulator